MEIGLRAPAKPLLTLLNPTGPNPISIFKAGFGVFQPREAQNMVKYAFLGQYRQKNAYFFKYFAWHIDNFYCIVRVLDKISGFYL